MTEQQWELAVKLLIAQGTVKTREEAERRLTNGEKLSVTVKVEPGEWKGLYGTA